MPSILHIAKQTTLNFINLWRKYEI